MAKKVFVAHLWNDEYCIKCYNCGYNNIFKLKDVGEVKPVEEKPTDLEIEQNLKRENEEG